jgi:hypothetical protein
MGCGSTLPASPVCPAPEAIVIAAGVAGGATSPPPPPQPTTEAVSPTVQAARKGSFIGSRQSIRELLESIVAGAEVVGNQAITYGRIGESIEGTAVLN